MLNPARRQQVQLGVEEAKMTIAAGGNVTADCVAR